MSNNIVVGITGATGQVYGVRTLELLADTDYESHLIISDAAKVNLNHELDQEMSEVKELADVTYEHGNIGAPVASGSFWTDGMIVTPCSMKTLSNIATGNAGDLITRTADVTLKERRPLVVMPREKPFNRIHLENMLSLTDAGGIVVPPFPSFYQKPNTIDEIVTRTVARALSLLSIDVEFEEWAGTSV